MQNSARNFFFIMSMNLIVGTIAIIYAYAGGSGKGLAVFTGKQDYQLEESVKITFRNNLHESVFSHIRSLTPIYCIKQIERQINGGQWEKLYAQCQYPNCTYEIDGPGELKPGESSVLEWKPLQFIDGTVESALLRPGIYRLAISYQNYHRNKWKFVYTNNFTIHSGREK